MIFLCSGLDLLDSDCVLLVHGNFKLFLASPANAAKENIQPYLSEVLKLLQGCLSTMGGGKENDEGELNVLHTQALGKLF